MPAYQQNAVRRLPTEYQEPTPQPAIRHKKGPKRKVVSSITILFIAIAIAAVLFMMIYSRVELAKLVAEYSTLETQMEQLQTNNASLASELESNTGLAKVEDYAENTLGLKKLDKAQIEYVVVPNETVIEVVQEEDKGVWASIKNWFEDVLEYFGA